MKTLNLPELLCLIIIHLTDKSEDCKQVENHKHFVFLKPFRPSQAINIVAAIHSEPQVHDIKREY